MSATHFVSQEPFDPLSIEALTPAQEKYYLASQWNNAYQAPTVAGVELSYPELLEVNLIDYDFQWAGDNKKANVDKFINEIAGADDLKE